MYDVCCTVYDVSYFNQLHTRKVYSNYQSSVNSYSRPTILSQELLCDPCAFVVFLPQRKENAEVFAEISLATDAFGRGLQH